MPFINPHTLNGSAFSRLRTPAVVGMLVLLGSATAWAQLPGRCEAPISERTGTVGCFVVANQPLGTLPDEPLFWHLYTFPADPLLTLRKGHGPASSRSSARSGCSQSRGAIGKPLAASWSPSWDRLRMRPTRVTPFGTLEGVVPPGEKTPVHTHAGPEAWYRRTVRSALKRPRALPWLGPAIARSCGRGSR